jgi:hypothetical protein
VIRVVAATTVALVVLAGCGSTSSGGGSASGTTSASASPSSGTSSGTGGTTHFSQAEADAINAAAGPPQAAARRALAAAPVARCNRLASKNIAAWRACNHALLDPYAEGLRGLANEFHILQVGSYPPPCLDGLKATETTFQGFAVRVDKILAGFDSPDRSAQVKAITGFNPTIRAIEAGYKRPFDALATACFTPAELKRMRASASASTSPGS